ncbi:MAG: hypothetical protein QHH10_10950 [Peptococcaceae bacterium]|jgi:phosphotransferase system  glucose/maltose/N-acetylglucosamine-specific IIC component|nr:hypothetical protein [Peptococcaceae bacterium]MDH7525817.1 hypothetical protein [Peptococcaceae bacterium]
MKECQKEVDRVGGSQSFFSSLKGNMIQVLLAIVIMGALSYAFWNSWQDGIKNAGSSIRLKIETDDWLSKQ